MYLVFDVGASFTRVATSKIGKKLDAFKKFETPKKYQEGLKLISNFVKGVKVRRSAGGIAGSIDRKSGKIFKMPNLPLWSGKPLASDLSKFTRSKVVIENDTALAGLGEAMQGAGKGSSIVAYVTVSTGINGALIINRKLVPTAQGFEIGHQIIDKGKSWEFFAGGASIKARFKKDPEAVLKSAQASSVIDRLTIGLHNTILHWSPEVLVLGGSQMKTISILDIKKYVTARLDIFARLPEIKKATLGDESGLYGALELLN